MFSIFTILEHWSDEAAYSAEVVSATKAGLERCKDIAVFYPLLQYSKLIRNKNIPGNEPVNAKRSFSIDRLS